MEPWMMPFARTINAAKKYVVSSTLDRVDWNAELVRGDLGQAVQQLMQQPGKGLFVGGVTLPLALAELGLIDEYELVVHRDRCKSASGDAHVGALDLRGHLVRATQERVASQRDDDPHAATPS